MTLHTGVLELPGPPGLTGSLVGSKHQQFIFKMGTPGKLLTERGAVMVDAGVAGAPRPPSGQPNAHLDAVHLWLADPPCTPGQELQQGVWHVVGLAMLNVTDLLRKMLFIRRTVARVLVELAAFVDRQAAAKSGVPWPVYVGSI